MLTGQDTSLQLQNLGDLLSGKSETNNVVLSLTETAQQAAADALGDRRGSVVALDVQTGAVLAMYSNPTFNPNGLSVHNTQVVQTAFNQINSGDEAALQRAYRDRYSPGSTFKVVTTKSAIETGIATPDDPCSRSDGFADPRHQHDAAATSANEVVRRHARRRASSSRATRRSRSSATRSATRSRRRWSSAASTARRRSTCRPARSRASGPQSAPTSARFALAGIGQGDVFTSPLQMALIAEGIANGGVIKEPHVVKEIQNTDGKTVRTIDPRTGRRACRRRPRRRSRT